MDGIQLACRLSFSPLLKSQIISCIFLSLVHAFNKLQLQPQGVQVG